MQGAITWINLKWLSVKITEAVDVKVQKVVEDKTGEQIALLDAKMILLDKK